MPSTASEFHIFTQLGYAKRVKYFRHHRNIIGLIAALAIVLNSVMPTLSHLLTSSHFNSTFLVEVCTATGSKWVADERQPPRKDPGSGIVPMCPYCIAHAAVVGLGPGNSLSLLALNLSYNFPTLFYQSPYPLYAWVSSSPRGPPVIL